MTSSDCYDMRCLWAPKKGFCKKGAVKKFFSFLLGQVNVSRFIWSGGVSTVYVEACAGVCRP